MSKVNKSRKRKIKNRKKNELRKWKISKSWVKTFEGSKRNELRKWKIFKIWIKTFVVKPEWIQEIYEIKKAG